MEDEFDTELIAELRPQPDEYFVAKRRYSAFFGTDLEILLKGLGTQTLILVGGLTDVCVHYSFVDGHQHDYHVRVVEDAVSGSTLTAHKAALAAMAYLQSDALVSSTEVERAFRNYRGPARPPVVASQILSDQGP